MSLRTFDHLLHYGELPVKRVVPLALALLYVSNPDYSVIDQLSRLSHDQVREKCHIVNYPSLFLFLSFTYLFNDLSIYLFTYPSIFLSFFLSINFPIQLFLCVLQIVTQLLLICLFPFFYSWSTASKRNHVLASFWPATNNFGIQIFPYHFFCVIE